MAISQIKASSIATDTITAADIAADAVTSANVATSVAITGRNLAFSMIFGSYQ